MVAAGNTTDPDMVPVEPTPRQKPLVANGNEELELGVSVCVALLHVLLGTETLDAVIVQMPPPRTITALPLVTSTDVVLVAVATQAELDVTVVGLSPRLLWQPLNVGPASAPAAFTVVARSPVALTFVVTVQVTVGPPAPAVRVKFPWPCTTVFCGSHVEAEAAEAPTSAIAMEAAATAVPNFFMLRMLLSFAGGNRHRE
jgi:hypothetical protein